MQRLCSSDSTAEALGILIALFPAFRFCHVPIGTRGNRWIAERVSGHESGLHTIITADLTELLAALATDRNRHDPW